MTTLEDLGEQLNQILIGLNAKIDALKASLNEDQLTIYESEIEKKREFLKSKLASHLTKEKLASTLEHLD